MHDPVESPYDDGLGVFVDALSGGAPPTSAGTDDDHSRPSRSWASLREWREPSGWRVPPVGALLGVVAVLVVAAAAVVALGAGGPSAEPDLPVSGAAAADADQGRSGATNGAGTGDGVPGRQADGRVDAAAASGANGRAEDLVVHVAGAVAVPGVHRLPPGARVFEAIAAAGGPLPGADVDRLNLAAPLSDGAQIVLPLQGAPAGGAATGSGAAGSGPGGGGGAASVSLSTADVSALDALPGIGPSTAAAIIAHREANGPFTSVDDLLEVRGIGQAKLEGLRDLVVP